MSTDTCGYLFQCRVQDIRRRSANSCLFMSCLGHPFLLLAGVSLSTVFHLAPSSISIPSSVAKIPPSRCQVASPLSYKSHQVTPHVTPPRRHRPRPLTYFTCGFPTTETSRLSHLVTLEALRCLQPTLTPRPTPASNPPRGYLPPPTAPRGYLLPLTAPLDGGVGLF